MAEINVKVPAVQAKSYKIMIGTDILSSLWPRLESEFTQYNKFIVTDENLVSAGHLENLLAQRQVPAYVISPAGEISKNIETVVSIIEAMEKACLGRDTLVISLGGGTVGDIAGFAAATFKRGVPIVHIPTTTVAQADSSIGGKTGVDSSISKNAFGAFWQPAAVYIDVAALKTLDDRQYRAGLVESVKHSLVLNSDYFDFIESNLDAILARKSEVLENLSSFNCKIKADVVETDPYEQNMRRILNYGHTIGHAAESASGFKLLHGEAVAIGIIGAGLIEMEMGLAEDGRSVRIRKILGKIGVPTALPEDLAEDKLINLMKHDKKAVDKWPRFVLLSRIGQVYCQNGQYAVEVERRIVEKVLPKLREN